MKIRLAGYISIGILVAVLIGTGLWVSTKDSLPAPALGYIPRAEEPLYPGDFVVVNLRTMTIDLRHGTTTLESFSIISKGKPGSYYETIGGSYENDYKIRNHFSTIGHVYMPWGVHVFGNFFIHGIPYYPDGRKVSTTYSGGCIRLTDEDAERVYTFVTTGTPIIITEQNDTDFVPTASTTDTFSSMDMTRLMVATISLEVLTQDNTITDTDGETLTTRKKLLPRLLVDGDDDISRTFAKSRGETVFVDYMNKKARALGLTNTLFTTVDTPATTSQEDQKRFMQYIIDYKTYLLTLGTSTEQSSH
ncbi:MAG: L,D-transpeptidase family protein [Candidatus Paceibacterota bacterium]